MSDIIYTGRVVSIRQLPNVKTVYGHYANGWVITDPSNDEEISAPFKWFEDAEVYVWDMGWEISK
jgi:hypothetical protein